MVLWTKLWYYGQNYGNIPRTMELRFTKEKTRIVNKKLRNFDLFWKNYGKIPKVLKFLTEI